VIDEAETILRMRKDSRHNRSTASARSPMPQVLTRACCGSSPERPSSSTPAHGVAGLAPLHDRIRFIRQGKYASVRQAQLELLPFEASRLKGVAMRLREMFPARDKAHLEARNQ